jgi:tRNA C32,U32 (ribose-2'-O)-methylase TrmJ
MAMNELDILLNRLMELYQIVLDNQKKKLKITPEIEDMLRALMGQIHQISEVTDQELDKAGIDQNEIKKMINQPEAHVSSDLKQILEKSNYLKKEIQGCRNVLKNLSKAHKKGVTQSEAVKKRQDKFKNIGSKKGWIPL